MYKCAQCGKEFEKYEQLGGHITSNHIKPRVNYSEKIHPYTKKFGRKIEFKVTCFKCNKEFSILEREKQFPLKEKYFCSRTCANSRVQTKEINEKRSIKRKIIREEKYCTCGKKLCYTNTTGLCPICLKKSPEYRIYLSKLLKGKTGGYREKGGRSKYGRYKGIWCQSSWELAWVLYNLDHHINFERNTIGFPYLYNGEYFKYYPDFKLADGTYVEIKGYMMEKDKEKILQFKENLIVIDSSKINLYLDYASKVYGKHFISVYDKETI